MKPTVVVTGAGGFIGSALMRQLLDSPAWQARALRLPASLFTASGAPSADKGWQQALAGAGAVVHLAARVHVMDERADDPLAAFRAANVGATVQLARAAAAHGVNRLVFISSVKVHGESTRPGQCFRESDLPQPQDAYGQSKLEAEQALQQIAAETGMAISIIRPPLVYGPGVRANFAALMRAVRRGWPLPLGAVHNRRSLVAVDNLADLIIRCLDHPAAANQTFLASDGEDLSSAELVRRMARAMGQPARLLPLPPALLLAAGSLLGKRAAVERLCGSLQVDSSKARTLLDWQPPLSVDEALRSAVQGMGVAA